MDATSLNKTSVVTYQGLYKLCMMSFGARNVSVVFQHLMEPILKGFKTESDLEFVDAYLNDVLIHWMNIHINHLQKVLECFEKANFKLNDKSQFCCSEVEY